MAEMTVKASDLQEGDTLLREGLLEGWRVSSAKASLVRAGFTKLRLVAPSARQGVVLDCASDTLITVIRNIDPDTGPTRQECVAELDMLIAEIKAIARKEPKGWLYGKALVDLACIVRGLAEQEECR